MGVEYYLIDHEAKTFLELPEENWNEIKENPEILLYQEEIKNFTNKFKLPQEKRKFIADVIWRFVKNADPDRLEIINNWCDNYNKYSCLGVKLLKTLEDK